MATNIFRWTFLPFLVLMALVAGGAFYQTISIVPFWEKDISMFRNYRHWGIDYFPVLSPAMTVLWLILLVTGFKAQFPNKRLLYLGHFLFFLIVLSTFTYFAPFLLTYMGNPQANISDAELSAKLHTWATWDFVRQVFGLIPMILFFYTYNRMGSLKANNSVK